MSLSERIGALREAAGIGQSDLAARVDVDRRLVHAWEKGYSRPGIDKLPALARALGVSIDALLAAEPDPWPTEADQIAVLDAAAARPLTPEGARLVADMSWRSPVEREAGAPPPADGTDPPGQEAS